MGLPPGVTLWLETRPSDAGAEMRKSLVQPLLGT